MKLLFIPFLFSLVLVGIIWFLALWDIKSRKVWRGRSPKVSFVVPAYNSQDFINDTIDSLFRQNYNGKTEIIVYGSGDLKGYDFKKYRKDLIFLRGKGKVEKAVAVNKAVQRAKGEFVFIVDSDTTLRKDALRKIIDRFSNKKVGAVTASRIAKYTGFWSLLQNFEYVMTNIILTSYNKIGSTIGIHGCAMCFRKKAFVEIKGIKRVPAQDFDAALRLIEKKWKVVCEIQAVSETITPGFFQWIKQRFRWMRGFSFALLNHYKVFFVEPFGLFFTIIYGLMGLIYVMSFFINQGFFRSAFTLILIFFSFQLPLFIAIGLFIGFFGWALYDRVILLILYSSLSIPYVTYPYDLKGILRLPLIFAYSLVYLPLFVITGIIGAGLALNDKIRGRKVVKW